MLVSGFEAHPRTAGQVLGLRPGVRVRAMAGIPGERSRAVVKLFVIRRDPALAEAGVEAYCRENFSACKRPGAIECGAGLPKSSAGTILRRELRSPTS